jgi:aminopeptidase-like protein
MKQIISDLFAFDRQLISSGYDSALEYIKMLIPLSIIKIDSGKKVGDWTVPPEWVVKDAWVKFDGKKILDYKKDPLCLSVYSIPVNKTMKLEEFKTRLFTSDERPDAFEYTSYFYERDWGFSIPKNRIPELKEGDYEVFIDSEFRQGTMKIGVHTIIGKTDREVLLFAHLDHPYQANDNLSGVATLIDLTKFLKNRFEHTIKIIFCPETIGSIAYAETQDISKVDFVIALDAVGNDNILTIQNAYDKTARINACMHQATISQGADFRKGEFRYVLGSDEYYFNDPKVGIPGVFISRVPYPEYHTSDDRPEIIKDEKLKEVQRVILRAIEIYEKDYIPKLKIKGVVMRSKYGIQAQDRLMNLQIDKLFFSMDGKRYLTDLISQLGISFDNAYAMLEKLGDKIKKCQKKIKK